jgi:predicted MPP superfamily phosphohydrolase
MILFALTVFLIYGSFHVYAFIKIKSAIPLKGTAKMSLMVFMGMMTIIPLVIHGLEKYDLEWFALVFSYFGYVWMGELFFFLSISLMLDSYRFFLRKGGHLFGKDFSRMIPSPRAAFLVALLSSFVISTYGYFEAKDVQVEKITMSSPKIPKAMGALKIVQISDVHIGIIVKEKRLLKIMEMVKKENPDILVCTGDLLDGQINSLSQPEEFFRSTHPRYGKYAVTGNHEFYAGIEQAMDFFHQSGFTVLRGNGITVANIINIVGVDDHAGENFGLYKSIAEKKLLNSIPRQYFTLLLKHRPLIEKSALGFFDLQLSGHTHNGQIFPFTLLTGLFFPMQAGYFEFPEAHSALYVSRGCGTWGPPMRFISPPHITIIELTNNENVTNTLFLKAVPRVYLTDSLNL